MSDKTRDRLRRLVTKVGLCVVLVGKITFGHGEEAVHEVALSKYEAVPLEPVFVSSEMSQTAAHEASGQIMAEFLDDDSARRPVRVALLNHFGDRGTKRSSMWLLDIPKAAGGKEIIVRRAMTIGKDGVLASVRVKPLQGELAEECERFGTLDTYRLLMTCLERQELKLPDGSETVLRMIMQKSQAAAYRRIAEYLAGCCEYERLERQFNNNGPEGAYKSCYQWLEATCSVATEDAIAVDAKMRLIRAKAWSSDYEEAKKLTEDVVKTTLSEKYRQIARRVLNGDLAKVQQERAREGR